MSYYLSLQINDFECFDGSILTLIIELLKGAKEDELTKFGVVSIIDVKKVVSRNLEMKKSF